MSDDIRESTCCPSSTATGEDGIFGYRVDQNDPHPPPVVTCPDSFTAWMIGNQYIVPDFSASITIDGQCAVDSEFTITQNPLPGTVITIGGSIIILITVTDRFGNVVTCSFTVTVRNPNTGTTLFPPDVLPPWVYAPNLLAYWSCNDTSCPFGATDGDLPCWFRRDLSQYLGNATLRHLTNAGGAIFIWGESPVPSLSSAPPPFNSGSMYSNNAANGYCLVPDDNELRLVGASFTIRFWFKISSITSGATWNLVGKYSTVGYRIKLERVGGQIRLTPELRNGSGSLTTSYRLMFSGVWIHVVMAFDATLGQLRLYQDGVMVESATSAGFAISGEASQFRIGQPATGSAVGALACWPLDDSNWADSIGSRTLTANGSVALVPGKINDAANVTSAYLYRADDSELRLVGTDFSIRCWIKIVSLPPFISKSIVQKYTSTTGYQLRAVGGADYNVVFHTGNGSQLLTLISANLTFGTWYHVVVTYNASTKAANLYIDGVLDDSATATSDMTGSAADLEIGDNSSNEAHVDEVCIWERELTGGEVSSDYSGGTGTSTPTSANAAAIYTDEIGIWTDAWTDARVAEDYDLMT